MSLNIPAIRITSTLDSFFALLIFKVVSLPASVPKYTVSLLKELANHGCRFAVSQIMGIATVVSFFAKTMHEISEIRNKKT